MLVMSALFVVVAIGQVQAPVPALKPKTSVLAGKPWWERIKPGDIVKVYAFPGALVPIVKMHHRSDVEDRIVRTDLFQELFIDSAAHDRLSGLHTMIDRDQVRYVMTGEWIQVVAVHYDAQLKYAMVEILLRGRGVFDESGFVQTTDTPPAKVTVIDEYPWTYSIPISYLGSADQQRHIALDRTPVLMRRPGSVMPDRCQEENCQDIKAIPYAEAEKAYIERRRRTEEVKRRGIEEAKRQAERRKAE